MRKALAIVAGFVILILALPTLKNAALFLQYEHGHTTLEKVRGHKDVLIGVWEGTFDTFECGIDERHLLQFTFESETRGRLVYRYLYERIGGYGAQVYDWRSLLPFDQKRARTYVADVLVEGENLVILPNEAFFTSDTLLAAYQFGGTEMRFAFVNHPMETPEEWGHSFSRLRPRLVDLVASW